ncbi:hypothetical protein BUALT_Bualt01G0108000 [Buddleja alternifolia]|uniref:LOB domain-containing protein n=1 Tax=Buddleja alternifolia TaxID=168488 RepID=A0AAV6YC23_9LAMI|nr:hypothetical protein BUALT_Bualt01G0108000 [Buddleja alternifolia]
MQYIETINTTAAAAVAAKAEGWPSSVSLPTSASSDPFSPSPSPPVILSPCAACKILRRRCASEKCILAPYFPPTEPLKFAIAHRIFGASNITKLLQELPETQREDAVNSMVYEANARLRDPVYGCAGAICYLQKKISELQAEVAKSQAEILNLKCHNANLIDQLMCKQMTNTVEISSDQEQYLTQQQVLSYDHLENSNFFMDEGTLGVGWEPLWT